MAGRVGWYGRLVRLGSLPDACSAGVVAFALCNLGVQHVRRGRKRKWLLER